MKQVFWSVLWLVFMQGTVAGSGGLAASDEPLRVITTLPDLADMARIIGGEHVTVETIARGTEDIHAVPMRASLAARLGRTDVVIEIGLGLEHAFLPALLEAANNPKLKLGQPGHIVASTGVKVKEIPLAISRAEGEQHPAGNPHVNLGPDSGKIMAANICKGLCACAPAHEKVFKTNCAAYTKKIEAKEQEWKTRGAALKGVPYVSFHADFVYFAEYFGMESVGTIEPKPGIPPSARHTDELIKAMIARKVKVIVREPQYSDRLPNAIADKTGARVAKVAAMVNGLPEATSWIALIDANLDALLKAVGQ